MKKRLRYLGGLFLAILTLYLYWLFAGKYPDVRWWLIAAFLIAAAIVFLCGIFFPDIPDKINQLLFRREKDE